MSASLSGTEVFLDLLSKSQVIDEARLQAWLANAGGNAALPADAKAAAETLIRAGLLTPFQAELLLAGKWRHFIVNSKYRVLSLLGSGGMGSVYLCEHLHMHRRVALKVLPRQASNDAAARKRFLREAQALSSLNHPNIVRAFDFDQDGNVHFLVMEYVEGVTLHGLVDTSGPLTGEQAVSYLYQAAAGLDHASRAGWIHRDIKPRNVLIDRTGTLKILDLGLAKLIHHSGSLTVKHDPGAILGTLDYLSPEQADPSLPLDIRSDIYSLGATFYYALTGSVLFPEATVAQKLLFHRLREPKALAEMRPELPGRLVAVIEQMLAKAPENRFQTAVEIMEALQPLRATSQPPRHTHLVRLVDRAQALRNQEGLTGNTIVFPDLLADSPVNKTRKFAPRLQPRILLAAGVSGVALLALLAFLALPSSASKPSSVAAAATTRGSKTDPTHPHLERPSADRQLEQVRSSLRQSNPRFDGRFLEQEVDNGTVVGLALGAAALDDLTPLHTLSGLRSLKLAGQTDGRAGLARLTPLAGLKLQRLVCTATSVTDLSSLRGMPLETLDLSRSAIQDLSPLAGMPLRRLILTGTEVKDLTPLRGMLLRQLDCRSCPLINLMPLSDLPDLKELWCDTKAGPDAALIFSLKQLETLNDRPAAESRTRLERLAQLKLGPWYLIGPFDNPNGKGFDHVYPPEQEIDFKKEYPGKNNETAKWHQPPFTDGQVINLRVFREDNNDNSVAYVYREIECPEAMVLPVGMACDDTLTVWLNGKKLFAEDGPHAAIPDHFKLTLPLQKGKNQLLMKICQGGGGWAFYFAVK